MSAGTCQQWYRQYRSDCHLRVIIEGSLPSWTLIPGIDRPVLSRWKIQNTGQSGSFLANVVNVFLLFFKNPVTDGTERHGRVTYGSNRSTGSFQDSTVSSAQISSLNQFEAQDLDSTATCSLFMLNLNWIQS